MKTETIKISASHQEAIQTTDSSAFVETIREKSLEQALLKANASAHKVAASLGMHLLGIHSIHKNILDIPGSNIIKASVDVEYRISGFNQLKIDFKIIKEYPDVYSLFKKEISLRWFSFKFWSLSRFFSKQDDLLEILPPKRALVVGHFSIPGGGGTFGDIEAQELVCEWLSEAHIEFDIASNNQDGVNGLQLEQIDALKYSVFIFVCGPWYPQREISLLLFKKFKHCVKIGVNLTTHEPGNAGFDYLLSRDNPDQTNVDIAFTKKVNRLPVVGISLIERQAGYGKRQRHLYVRQTIREYLEAADVAPIWLDTVAHNNRSGIKNSQQFESLIHKTDIVITNRLHGVVLGLKNSVPVIAIDAVAGGGKVTAQVKALGWPMLIPAEALTVEKLTESVKLVLDTDMSPTIQQTQQQAFSSVKQTKNQFLTILENIKTS